MPKQRSNLTTLAILTMLTLLTWVAVEAYQRFTKIDFGSIPPEVLEQLQPTLDKKVLDLIETRKSFSDEEISQFAPVATASSSAQISQPSASPQSTASAQPNVNPSPSPTAQSQ
jgi:hypothetical protein